MPDGPYMLDTGATVALTEAQGAVPHQHVYCASALRAARGERAYPILQCRCGVTAETPVTGA